jgi:hypothetical protein
MHEDKLESAMKNIKHLIKNNERDEAANINYSINKNRQSQEVVQMKLMF